MKPLNIIESFKGEYRFLSSFYIYDETRNLSVEHEYQAAKAKNFDDWLVVMSSETPAIAKKAGRIITVREDWNEIKLTVMEQLVIKKFATNAQLREKLLDTRGMILIEGNTWGDTFWGVCNGVGMNHLGKTLMKVRDKFFT